MMFLVTPDFGIDKDLPFCFFCCYLNCADFVLAFRKIMMSWLKIEIFSLFSWNLKGFFFLILLVVRLNRNPIEIYCFPSFFF